MTIFSDNTKFFRVAKTQVDCEDLERIFQSGEMTIKMANEIQCEQV